MFGFLQNKSINIFWRCKTFKMTFSDWNLVNYNTSEFTNQIMIKSYEVFLFKNTCSGVLNCVYLAKCKFTFVKKGGGGGAVPSYHVLYVHEYFWRKNKKRTAHVKLSRCHMRQSPRGACRVSPTGDRWCRLFCLDPFPRSPCWEIRAPIGRVLQTDALAAANWRRRQNLAPPGPPQSVHVFRHDTRSLYRKLLTRRCCSGWGSTSSTVACDWFLQF